MRAFVLASATLLTAIAVPAFAQVTYVYDNVFVPGSGTNSFISGLTDSGDAIVNGASGQQYIYSPGSGLTALAQPPASSPYFGNTAAYGINNSGVVVGTGCNCSTTVGTIEQGFILQNGTYTFFSYPGATNTIARSISSSGLITGYDNVSGGFVYNPKTGAFTAVYPPGTVSPNISYANSIFNSTVFTPAQGITSSGQIVGSALLTANNPGFNPATATSAFFSGFVYNQGSNSYTTFQVDGDSTQARGINNSGVITGFAVVGGITDGFVGSGGKFQLLSDPSANDGTYGEAINSSGQIAGTYQVTNSSAQAGFDQLGFIATPANGAASTKSGTYTFDIAGVGTTITYLGPLAAAGYQYQTGSGNPNFASVVLPIGFDVSNSFTLSMCNGTKLGTIAGGQTYSFGSAGVSCFDVNGISGVTSGDANALVTGVSFDGSGSFTGTVGPIPTVTTGAPEPATLGLLGLGFAGVAALRRRRRSA
jgi:hypothetical protein